MTIAVDLGRKATKQTNETSLSNFSQSTRPEGRVLWEELLVLPRFHSYFSSGHVEFLSPDIEILLNLLFLQQK